MKFPSFPSAPFFLFIYRMSARKSSTLQHIAAFNYILIHFFTYCIVRSMENADFITLSEARRILGVSRMKVWRLVKDGTLAAISNPLDKRQKLVRRSQVEALIVHTEARAA